MGYKLLLITLPLDIVNNANDVLARWKQVTTKKVEQTPTKKSRPSSVILPEPLEDTPVAEIAPDTG